MGERGVWIDHKHDGHYGKKETSPAVKSRTRRKSFKKEKEGSPLSQTNKTVVIE